MQPVEPRGDWLWRHGQLRLDAERKVLDLAVREAVGKLAAQVDAGALQRAR